MYIHLMVPEPIQSIIYQPLSHLNTPKKFFYALFSRVHSANGTK